MASPTIPLAAASAASAAAVAPTSAPPQLALSRLLSLPVLSRTACLLSAGLGCLWDLPWRAAPGTPPSPLLPAVVPCAGLPTPSKQVFIPWEEVPTPSDEGLAGASSTTPAPRPPGRLVPCRGHMAAGCMARESWGGPGPGQPWPGVESSLTWQGSACSSWCGGWACMAGQP